MKKKYQKQYGFTLLELLIVMLIIGLLAGLGLSSFMTVQKKSRDSRRKQDLVNVTKALEVYYNDWGQYPAAVDDGGIYKLQACGTSAVATCTWGEPWQGEDGMLYMSELPSDPSEGLYYAYQTNGNGGYYLYAHLENENDPDIATDASGDVSNYPNINCGVGNNCNYVIMSSNLTEKPSPIEL